MRATAARIRQWLAWPEAYGLSVPGDGDPEGPRRPVRPGDIAVLCHRRDELDAMRRELDRLGIPSVYSGDSSVLLSPAAEDMHAILVACASRRSAQFAAGAAMTRALGATADDIRSRRESWIGAIRTCARALERSGIDAALVELLERPIPHGRAGADADASTPTHQTALHLASREASTGPDFLSRLVLVTRETNACDAAGRTALHYTALSTVNDGRALELAEVLLKYANIDPRDADSEGRSAAEVAEARGKAELDDDIPF